MELGFNTCGTIHARLNRVGPFRERCVGFRGVGNVDLGLRVDMLGGNPRMARGYGTPRGRRVDLRPVHLDSNPRMARGFGAPRGRRVEKVLKCPYSTTYVSTVHSRHKKRKKDFNH